MEIIVEELGDSLLMLLAGGAAIALIVEVLNFVTSF